MSENNWSNVSALSKNADTLNCRWWLLLNATKTQSNCSSWQTENQFCHTVVMYTLPDDVDGVEKLWISVECFEYVPRLCVWYDDEDVSVTLSIQRWSQQLHVYIPPVLNTFWTVAPCRAPHPPVPHPDMMLTSDKITPVILGRISIILWIYDQFPRFCALGNGRFHRGKGTCSTKAQPQTVLRLV